MFSTTWAACMMSGALVAPAAAQEPPTLAPLVTTDPSQAVADARDEGEPATADGQDDGYSPWLTFGVGARAGYTPAVTGALGGLSLGGSAHLRLLYVLGLELSYDPGDSWATDFGFADARLKLSALLHVVPTRPVGVYLKAGLGGATLAQVVSVGVEAPSYHAAAGLLISLEHWVIGIEALAAMAGPSQWPLSQVIAGDFGSALVTRLSVSLHFLL